MLWAYLSEVREAVEYLIDKYNLLIYNTVLYTRWRYYILQSIVNRFAPGGRMTL